MVPVETLTLEHYRNHDGEYCEGYRFLDHFQLHEVERASVSVEADTVGWYLCAVFKEGHAPREKDHNDERPAGGDLHLLKLEVTVPCKCHEYVRCNK